MQTYIACVRLKSLSLTALRNVASGFFFPHFLKLNSLSLYKISLAFLSDGEVVDVFGLPHGYWEAKDTQDNLHVEADKSGNLFSESSSHSLDKKRKPKPSYDSVQVSAMSGSWLRGYKWFVVG